MGTKEETWLRGILDDLEKLDPAWEDLFAELDRDKKRWGPHFISCIPRAEELRFKITVGEEFTMKDLRKRKIRLDEYLQTKLMKRGIIRVVRQITSGAGGKGRIRNVYQRML